MLRRLYDWTMAFAAGPRAEPALAGVAFVESSVFPIPPDVLLVPMVLAERRRAWRYALVATAASVVGGLLGYVIGALLFDQVAQPILDFYGLSAEFDTFAGAYKEWGPWIVFIAGVTPLPYKVITIASGFTGLNLGIFLLASIVSRGLRFFIVAGLLYWVGPPIRDFIERRLALVFTAFIVLVVVVVVVLRYLV